ncbi:MAG: CopG family antitoxin [Dehalococcoidia bacterium]|nr:CopG family antitoxin [Dehalococcoidia bacterium]
MDSLKETKKSRLPRFRTVQEEAEFWDTHDTTEFEEEFTETRARFARPLDHILAVRLEAKTLSELARVAERLGIGPSTLVRMWVMEHLRQLGGESESNTPETRTAHPVS